MVDIRPKLKTVDGILVSNNYNEETLRSALNYQAQPDDIFLYVYPKAGTTWAQVILYTLTNHGEAFDHDMAKYFAHTPTLEHLGEEGLKTMHRPYVIKSHLPFDRIPYHKKAKYVCVLRNPKDVCTSYYYFILKIVGAQPERASFDIFFEEFINGNVYFGDYFEHLRIVWRYRDKPNVFITSYEQMKQDATGVIQELARFLCIEMNNELLQRILNYSSFSYM